MMGHKSTRVFYKKLKNTRVFPPEKMRKKYVRFLHHQLKNTRFYT